MNRMSLKLKGLSAAQAAVCATLVWSAACADTDQPPGYPGGYTDGQNHANGGDPNGNGSNGNGSNGGVPGGGDQSAQAWCDVLSILKTACQECHAENADSPAPMSLETYADLHAPAVSDPSKKVYELVGVRIHDERRPMPEPPRTLTAEQLQTLDAWIAAGAPGNPSVDCNAGAGGNNGGNGGNNGNGGDTGGGGDEPGNGGNGNGGDTGGDGDGDNPGDSGDGDGTGTEGPGAEEWPEDCEQVYEVRIADRPHTVRAGTETHPQFTVDAPWGNDDVQAVAIRPITDNKKVIHHWILYEGGGLVGRMVTSWSRGKDGMRTFPSDVGMYMPKGARSLRFDVHYYNLGSREDHQDRSGVEICVTRKFRKYTATTYMFSGPATAPANRRVTNEGTCTVRNQNGPSYLISTSPHMHGLGVHAKFARIRNGQELVLEDAPFNVDNQTNKPLDRVELRDGDKVLVGCTYDNPTSRTVTFGQNSDDEMCFNFALYYPMGNLNCTGGSIFGL